MPKRNISQPVIVSIIKLSRNFKDYFVSEDKSQWVNGRPVLLNSDVWCPVCEIWHANNSFCQQQC